MSPSELDAFLSEMEPDIRAAERDMREIETLESKGITSSGRLPGQSSFYFVLFNQKVDTKKDYEALQPRLDALLQAHKDDLALAASLERRVTDIMERHVTHVRPVFFLTFHADLSFRG